MSNKNLYKLYEKEIPATRTGLFYNLFSYPTKISPEVIAVYIATHTHAKDVILDAFGGSGTVAIAARLCEQPNEKMFELVKQLDVKPEWGPRKVIVYEIGQYGYFATDTMMNAPDADEFCRSAKEMLKKAEIELNKFYRITDDEGREGTIRHIIWSDVVICPFCQKSISYYDVAVKYSPFSIKKEGKCPCCGEKIDLDKCERVTVKEYDELLGKFIIAKKRVPQKIYGITGKRKWSRMAAEEDLQLYQALPFTNDREPEEIRWGDLYRAGYHQGITHLHHFYTKRNYSVMSTLWKYTEQYDEKIKNALQLMLLSYNASHSTLMTRVVAKKNSRDFVLTGAQSGVLYISGLPVEKNILIGIGRKIEKFAEAFKILNGCKGEAEIWNASSTDMKQLEDESVDYIFTDPPFGDYIPYAEVNQINELWLGKITDRSKEVIISNIQKKGICEYKQMLSMVFQEMNRVLKKEGKATVVFHSSRADVWNAMCEAMEQADMCVEKASILDKLQGSFKQVAEGISVKGDPIMLLKKGVGKSGGKISFEKIAEKHMSMGDCNDKHIYSDYIASCLANKSSVELDAKDAYRLVRILTGVNDG